MREKRRSVSSRRGRARASLPRVPCSFVSVVFDFHRPDGSVSIGVADVFAVKVTRLDHAVIRLK